MALAKAPKNKDNDPPKKKPTAPAVQGWQEKGYRVLVSPKRDYTLSMTVWNTELDARGVAVPGRRDIPLQMRVLSGSDRDLLMWSDAKADDIPAPEGVFKNTRTGGTYHELTEILEDTEVTAPPATKRFPCYGCQVRLDANMADEFGFENLKAMVDDVMSNRLYGKNYAFIDDDEGMLKLLPKFADYARTLGWDKEDAHEIFEFGMDSKIGPHLSEFPDEAHRFQRTSDGRLI